MAIRRKAITLTRERTRAERPGWEVRRAVAIKLFEEEIELYQRLADEARESFSDFARRALEAEAARMTRKRTPTG